MAKNIIFDTDIGGDCDDVMALDLFLAAQRNGDCKLTGVTYAGDIINSSSLIHTLLKFYDADNIPVGRLPCKEREVRHTVDVYAGPVVKAFAEEGTPAYDNTPDAVGVLRKLLVDNGRSTIAVTGWFTNIADLLTSEPDDISPLGGVELVRETVDEIVVMGCSFSHQNPAVPCEEQIAENGDINPIAEWNIRCDIRAAQKVFDLSPVPVIVSPYELGLDMISGAPMVKAGKESRPDSYSFLVHGSPEGRHSWDPATALYAIYGTRPWFYRTAPGKVTITDDGISYFDALSGGNSRILGCAMPKADIAAAMDDIVIKHLYN